MLTSKVELKYSFLARLISPLKKEQKIVWFWPCFELSLDRTEMGGLASDE
jgi:hypothetical protein